MKNQWKWRGILGCIGFCLLSTSTHGAKLIDTEILAGKIASSIQRIGPQFTTLAISRIKSQSSAVSLNINELIDYTNVKIVRLNSRRFKVTDRSKLQLLLKEQRIQLSEIVSPNEYKELGKILGVQVFVYGTQYDDALILKAIDVQTSAIIWAEVFPLVDKSEKYLMLTDLNVNLIQSLTRDLARIKDEQIQRISFWNIETPNQFSSEEVIDYLTVIFSKEQGLYVIDRENLQQIFKEQKLNQAVFIDESEARRLGELYGVDAFLYGSISVKPDNAYVASLKMMSIFSGVILWADLIKFSVPQDAQMQNPFTRKIQQRLKQNNVIPMVAVAGGTFIMGSNDPIYNSGPEQLVQVAPFLMDAYEVTNEQYYQFVKNNNHRMPSTWKNEIYSTELSNHPVVKISWEDAKLYCQFVDKRLPTEIEWERAIRGTKGRHYPWNGTSYSSSFAVTRESGATQSVSVFTRNRDVTPDHIYHLAGNVREFVADLYSSSESSASVQNERVIRGSSWAFGAYEAVGFYRGHTRVNLAWPDVGFRCAKSR
ncbi:SUMF1/EgtB/PvdO family nonheme iron enzyme [Deltaproteobacteria bacterium TL4]